MHRIALISAVLLLIFSGPASADGFGGAYRGPFDNHDDPVLWAVPRDKGRTIEVRACWPYFYEYHKEWILGDRIIARRREARGESGLPAPALVDRVLAVLEGATEHSSARVRDAAVLALGKTGRREAVRLLARRLSDRDPVIRRHALLALGLTKQKDALPYLRRSLVDKSLRSWAALGLALAQDTRILPVLLEFFRRSLSAGELWVAAELATAIGHLVSEDGDIDRLAFPLRRNPPRPRRSWSKLLRSSICHALGQSDTEKGRKWLYRALMDREGRVREAALLALDAPRKPSESWLFVGKRTPPRYSRMGRLYGVRGLAFDEYSEAARQDLADRARRVAKDLYQAQYAALFLGIAGHTDANDFFLESLTAENRTKYLHVNHSAMAMALGFTGDTRAKPALLEIVSGSEYDPDSRGYAALALALMAARDTLPAMRRALSDEYVHPAFVRSGCWALGLMGHDEDLPFLLSVLSRTDNDWYYARGAAAIALGLIATETSVGPLLRLADSAEDPTTRAFAIAALGWLIDRDAVPRIPLLFERYHYRQLSGMICEVMSCL